MLKKLLFCLLILLFAGLSPAWAENAAFDALLQKAQSGDVQAQFDLWQACMARGEDAQGGEWLRKAAEGGHGEAMMSLATLMLVESDPETVAKGLALMEKAAGQDNPAALNHMGAFYYTGDFVSQDYAKALELWTKAGLLGHGEAAFRLGALYAYGNEHSMPGEPDQELAAQWLERAYAADYHDAAYHLGVMFYYDHDYDAAREWLEKAAGHGIAEAHYALGVMYYSSVGVAQDYARALAYFNELAELELPEVMFMIGGMYANGYGTDPDNAKAFEYYESAAVQNHTDAQMELAKMCAEGRGLPMPDLVDAYMWYSLAASIHPKLAGEPARALERQLSQADLAEAQFRLARAYYFGYGGQHNPTLAYMRLLTAQGLGMPVDDMLHTLQHLEPEEIAKARQMADAWLVEIDR